jgi:phospholipid/cholesterol/gamma-HCH transport system substrate-binding protein
VTLENGHAVVTMDIFPKYGPIYRNASVLLRPRTPLKDMYLSLDPGTKSAGAIPNGGFLGVGATNPDVNFADILQSLDADTRGYLLLLLSGGAEAFGQRSATNAAPNPARAAQLRGIFKRFAPLNRDTAEFTRLLAQRQQDIRGSIHGLQAVTTALGHVETSLSSLITASNTNFAAISSQSAALEQALQLFPSTLNQTAVTFRKLRRFAIASGAAATAQLPFARALPGALVASRSLFKDTTPVLKNQIRPFAVAVQPVAQSLKPAAIKLAKSTPPLTSALGVLNTLFNTLAYQPRGKEQGYLFWGSWLSHIVDTVARRQDAQGAALNGMFMGTCVELQFYEQTLIFASPALGPILALLNPPNYSTLPGNVGGNCPV